MRISMCCWVLWAFTSLGCDGGPVVADAGPDAQRPPDDAGSDAGTPSDAGSDAGSSSLDDFLPPPPPATGEPREVFAGTLSTANLASERIDGPAARGRTGDVFLRNGRIRVVLRAPGRQFGPMPEGGVVIDADVMRSVGDEHFDDDGDGSDGTGNDMLGGAGLLFAFGRTVAVSSVEIVADGSAGGGAMVRFLGRDALDDYVNLASRFPAQLTGELSPESDRGLDVAVDYVLYPDSDTVEVRYTVFNPSTSPIRMPVGAIVDPGASEVFAPEVGFAPAELSSMQYLALEGRGVGYGVLPYYLDPIASTPELTVPCSNLALAGQHLLSFHAAGAADLFSSDLSSRGLHLAASSASTAGYDLVVGTDIGAAGARYAESRHSAAMGEIAGTFLAGMFAMPDARVGVFVSADDVLDADERPHTVLAADASGAFAARLAHGSYLLVGDATGAPRPPPARVTIGATPAAVSLDGPPTFATVDYRILEAVSGNDLAGRVTLVGDDPSPSDARFRDAPLPRGIVRAIESRTGRSFLDAPLYVEPGRYRVVVSHGPEYSRHEEIVDLSAGDVQLVTANLARVVDSAGYVRVEPRLRSHEGERSAPSPEARLAELVAEGVELAISSDDSWRTSYDAAIARLDVRETAVVIGEEAATFDHGRFTFAPLTPGASIDWGDGAAANDLLPAALFDAGRTAGARVILVEEPRALGERVRAYFDQTRVDYDFASGAVASDVASLPATLRFAPGAAPFSTDFTAMNVYSELDAVDSNGDGVREERLFDLALRDAFNLFTLGFTPSIVGGGSSIAPAGVIGTYVRVPDDSAAAIATGAHRDPVLAALSAGTPQDMVVSNGPLVRVEAGGTSALGRLIPATAGQVTLHVRVEAPEWAAFDTLEVFSNHVSLNGNPGDPFLPTALHPSVCFTSRQNRAPSDTCDAAGPAQTLTTSIEVRDATTGAARVVSDFDLTLDLSALINPGTTGDRWIVIRVYGVASIFPSAPLATNASFNDVVEMGTSFAEGGAFPIAVTAPVFVDANGDGVFTSR